VTATLIVESAGPIVRLTISNPGLRNALAPEIYQAFVGALTMAEAQSQVRAVIVTGADGCFCAGGNLNRLLENRKQDRSVQAASIDKLHALTRALAAFPKPVIAAVEGPAAGAGFSLALACDLIVAARTAKFVMSYVKVALSPDGGGSWFANRALARQSALQMLLLGEPWSAQRLHELGLVNEVVDEGAALAVASAMVTRVAALSPNALAAIKRLSTDAATRSLTEHLDAEKQSFVDCLHHADAGEAIDAFLQKRSARFPPTP
jgi:enoyl-CoA hydratase/carnithine racemase